MTIIDTIKRNSKKILTIGAVGAAVLATPVKGKTAEQPQPPMEEITKEQKQKLLEQALRSGAPMEEVLKHMDFPDFLPTTKDGQFNKAKAKEYAKALAPYIEVLAEKGESTSTVEAYETFKKTTGQENVSLQDFEKVVEIAKQAKKLHKEYHKYDATGVFVIAGLLLVGVGLLGGTTEGHTDSDSIGCGCLALLLAAGASAITLTEIATGKGSPENMVYRSYCSMYNTYVNETVKDQKEKIHVVELNDIQQRFNQHKQSTK